MKKTIQDACSEPLFRRTEPVWRPRTPQHTILPTSACSEPTIRPHQIEPPAYTNAPYSYSPPSPCHDSSSINASPSPRIRYQPPLPFQIYSTTDPARSSRSSFSDDESCEDDENVPLAQLVLYPRDAPPAYSTIAEQSYREVLLQQAPRHEYQDEEAALELMHADDVSFMIERVVATAAVMALLLLAGIWVGLVFIPR